MSDEKLQERIEQIVLHRLQERQLSLSLLSSPARGEEVAADAEQDDIQATERAADRVVNRLRAEVYFSTCSLADYKSVWKQSHRCLKYHHDTTHNHNTHTHYKHTHTYTPLQIAAAKQESIDLSQLRKDVEHSLRQLRQDIEKAGNACASIWASVCASRSKRDASVQIQSKES